MTWETAAVGAVGVLAFFGFVLICVRMLGRSKAESAKQETRADVMEASLEAKERFETARNRSLRESRADKLKRLLERSRSRRASR